MSKEKFVIVPQADIDKLEEARTWLCNNMERLGVCLQALTHVTPAMHQLTHRRYPEGADGLNDEQKKELTNVLIATSGTLDSGTPAGAANDLVHYWLTHALAYGVDDAITTWAKDIQDRGDGT